MRACWLSVLFLVVISFKVQAQDPQFSQYYASSQYLNPAFTGNAVDYRFMVHARYQWPGLQARFLTQFFAVDRFVEKVNSGVGIMVVNDIMGGDNLRSTDVHLQYAYQVNTSENSAFRFGLQAGVLNRTLDYSTLIFPDQFVDQGFNGATAEPQGNERVTSLDLAAGGVFHTRNFWVGTAFHHLNQPNIGFIDDGSTLPLKGALHMGYRIVLKSYQNLLNIGSFKEIAITPTINFKYQEDFVQTDVGIYAGYEQVLTGIWYRGIPVRTLEGLIQNNESFVFLVGFKVGSLSFSYSYDFVISGLRAEAGGAHELNLTFVRSPYSNVKKNKVQKRIPCPTFWSH
ncbi:MAG: type IX secretion system membrane protein PorP/SprF [Bacteroidota bacterium]